MTRLLACVGALLSFGIFAAEPVTTTVVNAGDPIPRVFEQKLEAERSKLMGGSKLRVGAMLGFKAPIAPGGAPLVSVQMVTVIDRSGSMSGEKMEMVHAAGVELVDRMDSADELGLVQYDNRVDILRPLAPFGDANGVKQLIKQISPSGGTNLGGGLKEGIDLFKTPRENSVKRLMLMTDGLANAGEQNPKVLSEWARNAFNSGTRISTIGVGLNYNATLLKQIAHAGGGEFYYVENRGQLPDVLTRELQDGRTMTVRDLNYTFRTQDGAKLEKVVGYPLDENDPTAKKLKIGDLAAKESRGLLLYLEVAAPDALIGKKWLAMEVDARWIDSEKNAQHLILPLEFGVTTQDGEVANSVNENVRVRILEDENYEALDKAGKLLEQDKRDEAKEVIKAAEARIKATPAANSSKNLMNQAGQLAQARIELEQGINSKLAEKANAEAGSFGQRNAGGWGGGDGGGRKLMVKRSGGSSATESAGDSALRWLAYHQEADGHWDTAKYEGLKEDSQAGTALALLTFLGAGHTEKVGEYKNNVQRAVAWLKATQAANGRLGSGELSQDPLLKFRELSDHALATLALSEAAGMANIPETRVAAQKALDFLCGENPFKTVLPLLSTDKGFTSMDSASIGWMQFALKSGKIAGLELKPEAFEAVIDFMTPRHKGESVTLVRERNVLETLIGVNCLNQTGVKRDATRPALEWVSKQDKVMPVFSGNEADYDHAVLYFGTMAYFNEGGDAWQRWNEKLKGGLVGTMEKKGDTAGSWNPQGVWKSRGRVFSTALSGLCLEVYYRYTPMLKQ